MNIKYKFTISASIVTAAIAMAFVYENAMRKANYHDLAVYIKNGDKINIDEYFLTHTGEGVSGQFNYWWPVDSVYDGLNPVGIAAWNSRADIVAMLIRYGVDYDPACSTCQSPIILAIQTSQATVDDCIELIDLLYDLNYDFNAVDNATGDTVLTALLRQSAQDPNCVIIQKLLEVGASPDAPATGGYSARDIAIKREIEYVFD